jgi:hypothetical protein
VPRVVAHETVIGTTVARPDALETLSAKLQLLDLSVEELGTLDRVLSHAEHFDAPAETTIAPPELLATDVQRAIVARTASALRVTHAQAAAAFADALEFLRASAMRYGVSLSPSAKVDEAWHQFVLFTFDYARYCDATAGGFIHHWPSLEGRSPTGTTLSSSDTFDYLVAKGHVLTPSLWAAPTIEDAVGRLIH